MDGYEPHDTIPLAGMTVRAADVAPAVVEGCTRGGEVVGTGRVLYRVLPMSHPGTHI